MGLFSKFALSNVTKTALVLLVVANIFSVVSGVSIEKDLALTESEKNALDKFRQKVAPLLYRDFMKHDIYLIRWLRARSFDINSAEAMLRSHINWRKDHKMDTILNEDWSDISKDFHATVDTYDKQGRPIGVVDIWSWDIRTVVLQGHGPRVLRYLDSLMENLTMQVFERFGKGMNVSQWQFLGNAENFNLIEHGCPLCIPYWIQFIQSLENNYPGWTDEFIIVEAPTAINIVLEAIRPFLSQNTRNALKIFGPNRAKWLPYIEQRIAKDQRRPQYGGTKPFLRN